MPDNEKESVSLSGSEKVEVAMVEPTAVFSRNELKATDEDNDGMRGLGLVIQRVGQSDLSGR